MEATTELIASSGCGQARLGMPKVMKNSESALSQVRVALLS